ncbi:MAG: bifunctional hydroxymethylpyrimidine kinase/phosphomethylpyrimidine kinase [Syntrophomonadaceae bacterium]|jgi:hydroxymethylpyrimidine/phosphomethylpyrimidine kinase|nr:bifunctional hydroxymethylpyrimidine kinase/phosphomethylpyrimidine kinase [Syntrophomonadaceae bacterium]
MKNVLTVAGSDSGGGAGIQADIKTMCALGCFAVSALTAVTAQNTVKVEKVLEISPAMVQAQIRAVYEDIKVDAVKIGMVSSKENIYAVARSLKTHKAQNVVLDPVMVSKSGYELLRKDAQEALASLIAIADLITPNIPEAEILSGISIKSMSDIRKAAGIISDGGVENVLIKGGHAAGEYATDILFSRGEFMEFSSPKFKVEGVHGSGCTLSSAIACFLAQGHGMPEAVEAAKKYVFQGIENIIYLGSGPGVIGHLRSLYQRAGLSTD